MSFDVIFGVGDDRPYCTCEAFFDRGRLRLLVGCFWKGRDFYNELKNVVCYWLWFM